MGGLLLNDGKVLRCDWLKVFVERPITAQNDGH